MCLSVQLKLKAVFYSYTKRISHLEENWILNLFNSKVVLHPNTRDESSSSVNTRITYILHILILQRVFKCTQRLCLRNSCFYALKDWIDVQILLLASKKKIKKFISRLLAKIEWKGKSILGWKLPYYLFNLNWLIFYVLCNSRYWKTVIERYLAFCWENLFSILSAFCSKMHLRNDLVNSLINFPSSDVWRER